MFSSEKNRNQREKEDGTTELLIIQFCLSERRWPIDDNVGEREKRGRWMIRKFLENHDDSRKYINT